MEYEWIKVGGYRKQNASKNYQQKLKEDTTTRNLFGILLYVDETDNESINLDICLDLNNHYDKQEIKDSCNIDKKYKKLCRKKKTIYKKRTRNRKIQKKIQKKNIIKIVNDLKLLKRCNGCH